MSRRPVAYEPHDPGTCPAVGHGETEPLGSGVDFAFADTVVAADLDLQDVSPPSGIVVSDDAGQAHYLMPVAYPPAVTTDSGITARVRFAWSRSRRAVRRAHAEMHLLWSATATLEEIH